MVRFDYGVSLVNRAMLKVLFTVLVFVCSAVNSVWPGPPLPGPSPTERENSLDFFSLESTYTFESDFTKSSLGKQSSLYNDFNYYHRFLIKGNWYFRAGIEYERYDFGGTGNGLPNHLQALYAPLAVEYDIHDHAGAGIEIDPGIFFQNHISEDTWDIPWKIFVTFPLKKDKVYGVIGVGGGIYQHPIAAPGGGIIWLINDKMRLEGVFPRPALVYEPNDQWQFRVAGELLFDSFRTDDVVTPEFELHHAVVQYSEIRFGFEAKYTLLNKIRAFAGAGATVRRKFEFFRADESATTDPAPYVKLGLEAKF